MTLGEALRVYRKKNNLTQGDIAIMLGYDKYNTSLISLLETTNNYRNTTRSKKVIEKIKAIIDYKEEDSYSSNSSSSDRIAKNFKTISYYIRAILLYNNIGETEISSQLGLSSGTISSIRYGLVSDTYLINELRILLNYLFTLPEDKQIITEELLDAINDTKGLYKEKIHKECTFIGLNKLLVLYICKSELTIKEAGIEFGISNKMIRYYIRQLSNVINKPDMLLKILYKAGLIESLSNTEYYNIKQKFYPINITLHMYFKKVLNMRYKDIDKKFKFKRSIVSRIFTNNRYTLTNTTINIYTVFIRYILKDYKANPNKVSYTLISELKSGLNDIIIKTIMYQYIPEWYDEEFLISEETDTNEDKENLNLNADGIVTITPASQEVTEEIITDKEEKSKPIPNTKLEDSRELKDIFDGMSLEGINNIKLQLFNRIFKLIVNNDVDLAWQYIIFVENNNLFDTSMLKIKYEATKAMLEMYNITIQ